MGGMGGPWTPPDIGDLEFTPECNFDSEVRYATVRGQYGVQISISRDFRRLFSVSIYQHFLRCNNSNLPGFCVLLGLGRDTKSKTSVSGQRYRIFMYINLTG